MWKMYSDQKSIPVVGFLTHNDCDVLRAKTGVYRWFTHRTIILPTMVICWLETSSPDEFGSESEQILNTIMPISQREFMNAWASVRCTPETVPGSHELRPSAYLRSRCEACFGGNHTLATAESYIGIVFSE